MSRLRKCKELVASNSAGEKQVFVNCFFATHKNEVLVVPAEKEKSLLKKHRTTSLEELDFRRIYGDRGVKLLVGFSYEMTF